MSIYASLRGHQQQHGESSFALLYHKLDTLKTGVLRRGLYLSPRIFERQLVELKHAGYQSPPADLLPEPGSRRVLITFDDGFRNVSRHGLPALERFGFQSLQFLVADLLGRTNEWDQAEGERSEPLMNADEVSEWLASGQRIGAHTCTHPHLPRLSASEAREEISSSKKKLEDRFGLPIDDFAYPYGEYNRAIRDLVEEAGFTRAWTTEPGLLQDASDPFRIPRFSAIVSLRNPIHLLRSLPWPPPSRARP